MAELSDKELVERARAPAYWWSGSTEGHEGENDLPFTLASRLEALSAENARLRALRAINDDPPEPGFHCACAYHYQTGERVQECGAHADLRQRAETADAALSEAQAREARLRTHASDCAVHNAPAFEPGPCDCQGPEE